MKEEGGCVETLILIKLGKKLKYYRVKTKLTQEAVAVQVEKTANYISKLECGQAWPSMKLMYQLAELYDCSVLCLLPSTQEQDTPGDALKAVSIISAANRQQQKFMLDFVGWYTNWCKNN
ncbi:MAG: helix-turn-helix transcriptional regulator [Christensenella sp.]